MKKVLAMMLALTMLSSTGVMCFADQGIDVSVSSVSVVESDVKDVLVQHEEKISQKQELIDGLDAIKNDTSSTFKDKAVKFWESVKDFVKKHYIKIGIVTGAIALATVAMIFGSDIADYIKGLFESKQNLSLLENEERIKRAKSAFTPIYEAICDVLKDEEDRIVNEELTDEERARIKSFQSAFGFYDVNGIIDADYAMVDLLDYATNELLEIIRSEENNKIVEEFLAAME